MANDDLVEMKGIVTDVMGNGYYQVTVTQETKTGETVEHVVVAHLSGKMKKFKIRVVLGDTVKIGVSPYDMTRGRIEYREK